ncbi:MAG: Gfo/Idh/MocA family oxidoreductase [Chloroflexi bacterium]|nr:Gfo/Idh/MocA family oxidoreductase [Chloroflexota bacterium]
MKPVRLGIIGLGLIWIREHRAVLATLKDFFEPVAFCDTSAVRRAEVAQDFPAATVVSDYQSLLELPEVEAVLVLTPIALNTPVALAALHAGKDVIMEKPIARSVAEGQTLVETARRLQRRLFVTEQLAYRHAEEQLAELIANGEIGELILWNRVQHFDADPAQGALRYDNTDWRKKADFPLGTLFDGGIHLIASLSKLFGTPETVFATGRQLRPDYGAYDHVAMLFQYANRSVGQLSYASCLPAVENHFHIHGTAGALVVEPDRLLIEKPNRPPQIISLPAENARAQMWQALAQAWQAGHDPYYTPERALQDVAILETVDRAIKTNQQLPVAAINGP